MIGPILCFDLGNTRLKCGIMQDGELREERFFSEAALLPEVEALLKEWRPGRLCFLL